MATTIYPSFILTTLRQLFRILDFEETQNFQSDKEWYNTVMIQNQVSQFLIILFLLAFYNQRGQYFFFIIMYYINYLSVKYNDDLLQEPKDFINVSTFVMAIAVSAFVTNYNFQQQTQYRAKSISNNRFKKLMDTSEEGILIVKEKETIEYLNDKFIEQQQFAIQ